jgi:acetyltransferase-like isoleucine patch superfamily enzyme
MSLAASGGCYINAHDGIWIGRGTIWGPNVTIVSQDHDPMRLEVAPPTKGIEIGRNCWLGAGSVILPGVKLGDSTVVGANSVVNQSFPEGRCLLAGTPAQLVKNYGGEHNS